jgi:hypothetical protein
MRREITLHSEAGYIFADCSRRNRFFLQLGGGPYMLRQLSPSPHVQQQKEVEGE